MLHYLWPRGDAAADFGGNKRNLCAAGRRSCCSMRVQRGGGGWDFQFLFQCIFTFSQFVVERQPHEAKTINCNKLRPTPCQLGGGRRGRNPGEVCNKCSPTSVGNVCLAPATLCCMQMRHVAPLLMPCNIVATSQRGSQSARERSRSS